MGLANLGTEQLRELYRRRAPRYDLTSHAYASLGYRLNAYRRRGVEALRLRPADTVVDVCCGTGANFADVERRIGPSGTLVGVDLTPSMLDRARARVRRDGWSNVTLVESDAEDYTFPHRVDAILSTYALTLVGAYDDVIRRGAASLEVGGRFVVVDLKAPSGWPDAALRVLMPMFRPFGLTLGLRDRHPWESLAHHLALVLMEERFLGTTYIAAGERRA